MASRTDRYLMKHPLTTLLVLACASTLGACTITDTPAPPLSGPSEMSRSLIITATPDVLSLDGASRSTIKVLVRDENGQPLSRQRQVVPMRVEILADGVVTDFGTLSTRIIENNTNGEAEFTYTAPTFVSGTIPSLSIGVTPSGESIGNDAAAQVRRMVSIRLVPPGVIGIAPTANFTFTPESPLAFSNVLFDGATSVAGIGATITNYRWDFGDGSTGNGISTTHQYSAVGTYRVTLTVTDSNGLSTTSAPQLVTVTAGAPPTASFLFSPTAPTAGSPVFFNASASVAGTGHSIVSYRWNWGDGTASSTGVTRSHTFAAPGTYVVVLIVTDEVGQTATTNLQVLVN